MLNIVVPMAGAGSRFASAGYLDPKPLIPIHGVPMIQIVIANLRPVRPHRFVFIIQANHDDLYDLTSRLKSWAPGCTVVRIDGVTDGAARTVLAAEEHVNLDEPLMIANSDQYVTASIDDYLAVMDSDPSADGMIMTMTSNDPKWSYAELRPDGSVVRVVEKDVISDEATVGIYNFSRARSFFESARIMIGRGELSHGEYYVAPTYNIMTNAGQRVLCASIGDDEEAMVGLGTPSDLERFLSDPRSREVAGRVAANS